MSNRLPAEIKRTDALIAAIQKDMDTLAGHPHPEDGFAGMKVRSRSYLEKDKAGEALIYAVDAVSETEPVEIGSYRGFGITAQLAMFGEHKVKLKGAAAYTIDLGGSAAGNITRIENILAKLPEYLGDYQSTLTDLHRQLESARAEAAKPFALETELQQKSARLAELDAALDLNGRSGSARSAA